MIEPSVFTLIINGEINQHIVYQDSLSVVIMTHEPLTPGHCMVVPREQIDSLWDVTDELYQHLMMVAKKMVHKMEDVYDYKRIGMIVEGFGVPHAHIHVFGLNTALNPTIVDHMSKEHPILSPEELQADADKMRIN